MYCITQLWVISWQLASLMFLIRQSGALKLLLFQLGYRKFFDPEAPGFEGQKTGFGVEKCPGSPAPRGSGNPRVETLNATKDVKCRWKLGFTLNKTCEKYLKVTKVINNGVKRSAAYWWSVLTAAPFWTRCQLLFTSCNYPSSGRSSIRAFGARCSAPRLVTRAEITRRPDGVS